MTEARRRVAFCPNCGNTAPQELMFEHSFVERSYDAETGVPDEAGPHATYYVARCSTCDDLLVYYDFLDEVGADRFTSGSLLLPKNVELPGEVPATVRRAYAEASRIRLTAPNAYAVMLRRALEALCDDRGASGRDLRSRLQILVERGELPVVLAELTSALRVLGNAGAHHGTASVTLADTWSLQEFFLAVIEYVYVAPAKLAEFQKRLKTARPLPP